ncbi:MAG: hypothetical protein Q4D76_20450 [Oscillospiraceae bacterium]|nr:hypothetical protein [Oscillospiraceae bacterium]
MSVTATLTIDCSNYSDKIFDIILLFNKIGWTFVDGKMHYSLFDNNDVDFHYEDLSYERLEEIITARQNAGKLTAVRLYNSKLQAGFDLAADSTKEIILWIDMDRKTINGSRYTDASFYIINTVGELNKIDWKVEYFKFEEY